MIELVIQMGTHWEHYSDADPSGKYFLGHPLPIRLRSNVHQWMCENLIPYKISTTKVAHSSKKFQVNVVSVRFQKESHAVLFKLTWL